MLKEILSLPKIPGIKGIRNLQPRAKQEFRNGMLFLSPWLVGFLAFTLIPMIATFVFTFMDIKITDGVLNPPNFVGLKNYQTLLKDMAVWNMRPNSTPGALWVTIRFGLIALPVGIFAPLGLALLMNSKYLKGQSFFRSMFYMPYIIPFVASVFLWGGVLNPETGWINRSLIAMGMPKEMVPGWANDIQWVYPTYVIMGIWGIGNAMLIFLASLQNVPTELYDAAEVDGASGWESFWNVTIPLISPVIFYNLILSVVGLFQYFLVPLVINQGTGRPGGATMFYNLYLYKNFFVNMDMSYGSTLAWLLFLVILIVTVFMFWSAKYWVYYASDKQ